ncbi:hypothetical protein ACTFIR_009406 [Dictyostelium discoideum]
MGYDSNIVEKPKKVKPLKPLLRRELKFNVSFQNEEELKNVMEAKSKFENNWKIKFYRSFVELRKTIPLFLDVIRVDQHLYYKIGVKCAYCLSKEPAKNYILCSNCFRNSEGTRRRERREISHMVSVNAQNKLKWQSLKEKIKLKEEKTAECESKIIDNNLLFGYF